MRSSDTDRWALTAAGTHIGHDCNHVLPQTSRSLFGQTTSDAVVRVGPRYDLAGQALQLECDVAERHRLPAHQLEVDELALDLATTPGTGRCCVVREQACAVDWSFPSWADLAQAPSV